MMMMMMTAEETHSSCTSQGSDRWTTDRTNERKAVVVVVVVVAKSAWIVVSLQNDLVWQHLSTRQRERSPERKVLGEQLYYRHFEALLVMPWLHVK